MLQDNENEKVFRCFGKPEPNVIKLFTAVICKICNMLGKPFLASLLIMCKARSLPD
jgi:hypothetical protein